jgi:hypothetical protein
MERKEGVDKHMPKIEVTKMWVVPLCNDSAARA